MRKTIELDEKGFVFIDAKNEPYHCRLWYDKPFLFYWHKNQKSWVSLRECSNLELSKFYELKLTDKEADIYHTFHKSFISRA